MTETEIRRLRELEEESAKLKRMYADVSLEVRALKDLIEERLVTGERLPKLFEGLKDKQRLDVILKLMSLVLPKAKPMNHNANEPNDWLRY